MSTDGTNPKIDLSKINEDMFTKKQLWESVIKQSKTITELKEQCDKLYNTLNKVNWSSEPEWHLVDDVVAAYEKYGAGANTSKAFYEPVIKDLIKALETSLYWNDNEEYPELAGDKAEDLGKAEQSLLVAKEYLED